MNGYGVGDLVCRIQQVSDAETASLLAEYDERYSVAEPLRPGGERRQALQDAARIELGLRAFFERAGLGHSPIRSRICTD